MKRVLEPVRIESEVLQEIARRCVAAYPQEALGALLGSDHGSICWTVPLERRGARVSPWVKAEADRLRLRRVGSWQSHPEGLALPREADRKGRRDGGLLVIVAVGAAAGPREITAWRVESSRRHFRGIPIEDGESLISTLDRGGS